MTPTKKDIFAAYRLPYQGVTLCQEAEAAGRPFTWVTPQLLYSNTPFANGSNHYRAFVPGRKVGWQ